jgi:hypothetical protein
LCNFLHSPVTSSVLSPNILLSTLFSNTLSLCSSLSVRYQVILLYYKSSNMLLLVFVHNQNRSSKGRLN